MTGKTLKRLIPHIKYSRYRTDFYHSTGELLLQNKEFVLDQRGKPVMLQQHR